jgi:hypothetical protein
MGFENVLITPSATNISSHALASMVAEHRQYSSNDLVNDHNSSFLILSLCH